MKSISQNLALFVVPAILAAACGAKPSAALSSSNVSYANVKQSDAAALTLSWVCKNSDAEPDSGIELEIFTSAQTGEVEKVEILSKTAEGKAKRAAVAVCHTDYPAPEVRDGAVVATCNDTDWVSGHKVELSLGGFIPFSGTATVFAGTPGNMEHVASLMCRKGMDAR